MAGLLAPLFKRRGRAVTDGYHDYLTMSWRTYSLDLGPRVYRWVTGREEDFADPVSRIIAILIRDAIAKDISEFIISPGAFRTRVLFGNSAEERLRLPQFHAPLLVLRLRGLTGMRSATGSYPQQGSFSIAYGRARYGILVTIAITPWGEQATLTVAVAAR